mmetsp:Transcript_15751/g.28575  ORF Transcript_15751/g.28575 Transcript_15751/m.28575 type:complete len:83 (+) Transcript_15751:933-1181(+)
MIVALAVGFRTVGLDRGGRGEPELYLTVPLPIYPHRSPRYSILPKDEKYEECIHLVVLAMMTNEVMRQLTVVVIDRTTIPTC